MERTYKKIKSNFLRNCKTLGNDSETIIDELDMTIYQHKELRGTPLHDELLRWGECVLENVNRRVA
ncbi:MAG: hypothetical protein V3U58_04480 [Thermodesulfobacteriota bacterium]